MGILAHKSYRGKFWPINRMGILLHKPYGGRARGNFDLGVRSCSRSVPLFGEKLRLERLFGSFRTKMRNIVTKTRNIYFS
jgi:hypothetical protein